MKGRVTLNNKEKTVRIKKEIARLKKLFSKIEKEKRDSVSSLIENIAFMTVSLEELRDIINAKGYTEEYQNGANQKGVKKCSEVEIYNVMIKNYISAFKQLNDLLPREEKVEVDDGFEAFINSRRD